MYAWQRELSKSTAVDHAVSCNITRISLENDSSQLATVSANHLTIYDITFNKNENHDDIDSKPLKIKQVLTWKAPGTISSIEKVRFFGDNLDCLILAFAHAKIITLGYDAANNTLVTKSMHHFESEDMGSEIKTGVGSIPYDPLVRVDPDQRCAVTLVYGSKMVVLPFRRMMSAFEALKCVAYASDLSVHGKKDDISQIPQIMTSYTFDLKKITQMFRVIDFQFLAGYSNPTIMVLFEREITWSGRSDARVDTCSAVVLSLNPSERSHPVVWKSPNLPYDCFRLQTVPKPIGGCLVFTPSTIIWLDQSAPPCGVSVNSMMPKNTGFKIYNTSPVKLNLESCVTSFINELTFLLTLKHGDIFTVTLLREADTVGIRDYFFKPCKIMSSCPSVIVPLNAPENTFIYYGSRLGNSFILRTLVLGDNDDMDTSSQDSIIDPTAESQMQDILKVYSEPQKFIDPVEKHLYGESNYDKEKKRVQKILSRTITFEDVEEFTNLGPLVDATLVESHRQSYFGHQSRNTMLSSVFCSGFGQSGAIVSIRQFVRPHIVTSIPLKNVQGLWTLFKPENLKNEFPGHDLILLAQKDEHQGAKKSSLKDISLILETGGKGITEAMDTGFNVDDETVFSTNIGKKGYIVQATKLGAIILLEGKQRIFRTEVGFGIQEASVVKDYLAIRFYDKQVNTGKVAVFKLEDKIMVKMENELLSECTDVTGLAFLNPGKGSESSKDIIKRVTMNDMDSERIMKQTTRDKIEKQLVGVRK